MSIPHLAKLSLCITWAAVFGAMSAGQALSPVERQRILREQDVKTAGNSGDKSFVPDLYEVIAQRKHDHKEWDDVQMALAKLGEREQQQEIACIFYRGNKYEAQVAGSRQLPYVGGWFAIQLYAAMLADEKIMSHWFKAHPKDTGDEVLLSPQSAALNYLPGLVSGLPPINEKDWKATQRLWLEYIRRHEAELRRLVPSGDGVDFSGKSCKSKPREHPIH